MGKTVKIPGSCGELVQGYLNNSNFLISCPIEVYNTIHVSETKSNNDILIDQDKYKTKKAILKLLSNYGFQKMGLKVEINAELPEAKGMGSSTADITGAMIATTLLLDKKVELDLITKIALEVEPSDATFMDGIVMFDHLKGKQKERIGEIEPISLSVFDYGGKVDTLSFNSRKDLKNLNRCKAKMVKNAYRLVEKGIKTKDKKLIGKGATISSIANQNIIKKPGLINLINTLKSQKGFLGVNTAHSGTVIGVMMKNEGISEQIIGKIKRNFPKLNYLFNTRIINGGYKII
jgi:L-threonine kinase